MTRRGVGTAVLALLLLSSCYSTTRYAVPYAPGAAQESADSCARECRYHLPKDQAVPSSGQLQRYRECFRACPGILVSPGLSCEGESIACMEEKKLRVGPTVGVVLGVLAGVAGAIVLGLVVSGAYGLANAGVGAMRP